jgi:hypothetical protein
MAITWHFGGMRAQLCLALLCSSFTFADEAADRNSIDRAIAALNELPLRPGLLSEDALLELSRLPRVTPDFGILSPSSSPSGSPSVSISHEPWREATIELPGSPTVMKLELLNPRISNRATRFVTQEVAVADGTWVFKSPSGTTQTIPIFFVLKKDSETWRIEVVRVLLPR